MQKSLQNFQARISSGLEGGDYLLTAASIANVLVSLQAEFDRPGPAGRKRALGSDEARQVATARRSLRNQKQKRKALQHLLDHERGVRRGCRIHAIWLVKRWIMEACSGIPWPALGHPGDLRSV